MKSRGALRNPFSPAGPNFGARSPIPNKRLNGNGGGGRESGPWKKAGVGWGGEGDPLRASSRNLPEREDDRAEIPDVTHRRGTLSRDKFARLWRYYISADPRKNGCNDEPRDLYEKFCRYSVAAIIHWKFYKNNDFHDIDEQNTF
jgi:hypothetical protein